MENPDHDPLLAGLAAGDARALGLLYDRFGVRLYRVALGILRRQEDAEDAVQEVFVALVRSRQRLHEVRDLQAYLFTALRRAAGRCAAQRARLPIVPGAGLWETPDRPGRPCDDRRLQALERAIGALPPQQREVMLLKIDGELTFAEIGQVMGISSNTAASRYRYALEKLREMLQGVDP